MFDPSKLTRLPFKDTTRGQLVVAKIGQTQHACIVVQAPGEDADGDNGVMTLPSGPGNGAATTLPFFHYPDDWVISLNASPEFVWTGSASALSDAQQPLPSPGFLAATPKGLVISGRGHLGKGRTLLWETKTGLFCANQDVAGTRYVFIREWRVGLRDVDNKFHELAKFPISLG